MSIQEGGGGIRTSNICFIRRGPQPIELLLGDIIVKYLMIILVTYNKVITCDLVQYYIII